MNREIKFRAWDTEEKRWFPKDKRDEWINICPDGDVVFGDFDGDVNTGDGRFEIQISTGLKDKNGKEIYEGDIIIDENRIKYSIKFGTWSDLKGFDHIGFYLWDIEEKFQDHVNEITDMYEVIGNIHENLELLK